MTRSTGKRVVLVLAAALIAGSWMAAGVVESPGRAADALAGSGDVEPADGDWLWSANDGAAAGSYAWAEGANAAHTGEVEFSSHDYSWDDNLRVEGPKQSEGGS